jgi:HEAT repeat protein
VADIEIKITTAAGLMALPTIRRKEMLGLLPPGELDKVFRGSNDLELKKAVIDSLEKIGSAPALDVLHTCLEDPDPEVQLRALEAAERLLKND